MLAAVSGDAAFADDFFARYIQGREVVDYEAAACTRRPRAAAGVARPRFRRSTSPAGRRRGRPRVTGPAPLDSPAYTAGLDRDDVIVAVGGAEVAGVADVERLIRARKPGDEIPIVFERRGQRVTATLRLVQDPRVEIVPGRETSAVR